MAKQLLVYVENNRCVIFGNDLAGMQQIDFPPDVIQDLDILNKESMYSLIQTFIENYQILPATIIIILSTLVTFDKDLSDVPPEQQDTEAKKFLDQVPFQTVLPYRFGFQNKLKIIAANKDFVYAIKTGFEKRACNVVAVVPFSVLQEVIPELASNLDFNLLLAKIESIKQYNMLGTHTLSSASIYAPPQKEKNKTNPQRLYLLVGVFVFLILILIVVMVINFTPQARSTSSEPVNQSVQGASTKKPEVIFYNITVGGK